MTNFILPAVILVLCGVSFMLFIRDHEANILDKGTPGSSEKSGLPISMLVYSGIMMAVMIGVTVLFGKVYAQNNILSNTKRLVLLAVIWPVAYIDFKTLRIPNLFVIYGLACRVAMIPFELLLNSDRFVEDIVAEVISALAMFLAAVLCGLLAKGSIGAGDMKLLFVMGLFLGMDGSWNAIFTSLILSFIAAVYLLVAKKASRKDAIPFGPALVLGTFISVSLTGM